MDRAALHLIDELERTLQHAFIKYVLQRPFDAEISVEKQIELALRTSMGEQLFLEWLQSEADEAFMDQWRQQR